MPLLSIIVPIYNAEAFLDKCLASLIEQSLKDIEIILVNDCSTDNSLGIMKKFATDQRVKILDSSKNEGVSVARNKGISISTGKYIAFVDSDDWCALDRYRKLCIGAEEYHCDAFLDGFVLVDEYGKEIGRRYQRFETRPAINRIMIHNNNIIYKKIDDLIHATTPWNGIYSSSLIQNNKLRFQNVRSEDAIFNFEFMALAQKVGVIYDCGYYYRVRKKSLSHSYNSLEKTQGLMGLERAFEYLKAHPWLPSRIKDYKTFVDERYLKDYVTYSADGLFLSITEGMGACRGFLNHIANSGLFREAFEDKAARTRMGVRKRLFSYLLYNKKTVLLSVFLWLKARLYLLLNRI